MGNQRGQVACEINDHLAGRVPTPPLGPTLPLLGAQKVLQALFRLRSELRHGYEDFSAPRAMCTVAVSPYQDGKTGQASLAGFTTGSLRTK